MKKYMLLFLSVLGLASCTNTSTTSNTNETSKDVTTTSSEGVTITRGNFKTMQRHDVDDVCYACPSIGNSKMLVIPVNLNSSKATDENLNMINIAYNGNETSTGWESLKTYYQKSSNNLLNFDITVLNEWFTPSHKSSYYDSENYETILGEALNYYDSKINFKDYDSDSDGIIDGIELIYNCSTDYDDENTAYWAYTNDYSEDDLYDGLRVGKFVFSGIDFFHGKKSNLYNTADILVDAHTIIHETGHLLGLDDYYDYDSKRGASGGTYSAMMQDANIGDQDPYSKILLGWVEPLVIPGGGAFNYDLSKFEESGDCIILSDHELTSLYDEFFILEYYTEDGLNAHDEPIKRKNSLVPCKGIRVYHINSELNLDKNGNQVSNPETYFGTVYKYDNSYTDILWMDVITKISLASDKQMTEEALFTNDGTIFGSDNNKDLILNDGKKLFFTFKVESLGEKASLSFNIKNS